MWAHILDFDSSRDQELQRRPLPEPIEGHLLSYLSDYWAPLETKRRDHQSHRSYSDHRCAAYLVRRPEWKEDDRQFCTPDIRK
jgi:hypothetical protein